MIATDAPGARPPTPRSPRRGRSAPMPSPRFGLIDTKVSGPRMPTRLRAMASRCGARRGSSALTTMSTLTTCQPDSAHAGAHLGEQLERRGVAVLLVGRGKERAEVAESGGAEQRVGHRVGDGVGVGVAGQAAALRGARRRARARARRRRQRTDARRSRGPPGWSSGHPAERRRQEIVGVVILRLRGSPATTTTLPPAASTARRRRWRRRRRRARRAATSARNACGVCTATSRRGRGSPTHARRRPA